MNVDYTLTLWASGDIDPVPPGKNLSAGNAHIEFTPSPIGQPDVVMVSMRDAEGGEFRFTVRAAHLRWLARAVLACVDLPVDTGTETG